MPLHLLRLTRQQDSDTGTEGSDSFFTNTWGLNSSEPTNIKALSSLTPARFSVKQTQPVTDARRSVPFVSSPWIRWGPVTCSEGNDSCSPIGNEAAPFPRQRWLDAVKQDPLPAGSAQACAHNHHHAVLSCQGYVFPYEVQKHLRSEK